MKNRNIRKRIGEVYKDLFKEIFKNHERLNAIEIRLKNLDEPCENDVNEIIDVLDEHKLKLSFQGGLLKKKTVHICPYCKQACAIETPKNTKLFKIGEDLISRFCEKSNIDYGKVMARFGKSEFVFARFALTKSIRDDLGYLQSYIGQDFFHMDKHLGAYGSKQHENALETKAPMSIRYQKYIDEVIEEFKEEGII